MKTNLRKLLPGVKENISLKNSNTFFVGGKAKYFFEAQNKKDIIKAIKVAKKLKTLFFILGKGSNLLISGKGFKGLIIKIQSSKFKVQSSKNYFKFICDAGVPLTRLVSESLKSGATGIEWAVGIPGTLGGAIYGDAGSFGKSISDNIEEVEIFDSKERKIKILKNKECRFSYRESIFKRNNNFVILSAKLKLGKGKKSEIEEKIRKYLNYRRKNQPLNFPSIGSIFKNPAPSFALVQGRSPNFLVGELIEKCGLKGKKIGGAKISEKHANFIVNLGKAKAEDIKKLIDLAKKKVKQKFNINLKEEIQYLGF